MSIALYFPLFLLSLTKFFRFGILFMPRSIPSRLRRHLPLQSRPQRTPLRRIRSIRHIHIHILLPIPPIPPRLGIELMASVFIPIMLFMFGWSARKSVHWIVPVIVALYLSGIFFTFQSILMYTSIPYSKYTGSVLASNGLLRCVSTLLWIILCL